MGSKRQRDHREMKMRGITFLEEPRVEDYGTVAVLYGNKWDLLERKTANSFSPLAARLSRCARQNQAAASLVGA